MAESLEARVKKDPKLLARVLKNPGLRSKLPAKYLTKDQQARRKLNVRLKAPIVPGSTTTEGALAGESKAAMDVRYGPRELAEKQTLGEEKTRLRDTGGFYDQYLAQVAQHARNVQGIGATAAQTGLGLQQGITGLSQAGLAGVQNPAVADATSRGATAGDLSPTASSAAAIRQALVGSFVAQQAGQSAAASNYADTQAHVVAPGQKLGAQAMQQGRIRQADEKITATATERGQGDFAYRAERRADEAKSILAEKIATGKSDIAGEELTIKKDQAKAEKKAGYVKGGSKLNSFGFTFDEWTALGEKGRKRERDRKSAGKPPSDPIYSEGAFAGKRKSEIDALPPAEVKKLVDAYNKPKPAAPKVLTPQEKYNQDFFKKYGVNPVSTAEVGTAKSKVSEAKEWLKRLGGNPSGILTTGGQVPELDDKGKQIVEHGTKKTVTVPKLDAIWVRVAMELKSPGYISAGTADRLHRAGYSVKTLGLPSTAPKASTKPPAGGILGAVGGAADRVAGSVK